MKDQNPENPGEPSMMFLIAIPPQKVRPFFDHIQTLPPEALDGIRIAGCALDGPAAPEATPDLFAEDRTDG